MARGDRAGRCFAVGKYDNTCVPVGEASASPGWRDGPLLRGLRDKVADAFGASDPVLQDTQLPLLVGDLYARLLVEEAHARDEP